MGSGCRQGSLAEFAPAGAKKFESVFCRGVYLAKDAARPASVRASLVSECAQRAAIPLQTKAPGLCLKKIAPLSESDF